MRKPRTFVVLSALVILATACTGSEDDGAGLGEACATDDDCAEGVCSEQVCRAVCFNQDSCATNELCVHRAGDPEGVDLCIVAADFAGCTSDRDCDDLLVQACAVVGCDHETGACTVSPAADGTACTAQSGEVGACTGGACVEP
jgi:hypothetical protein